MTPEDLHRLLAKIDRRLDAIDDKLESLTQNRNKSLEWIGQLGEQINSLDAFREEVRASFEPVLNKLGDIDDVMRILRSATSDVARRVEKIEWERRKAG
jgi:uncharacterized coiled-coil DUF342 family protein